MSITNWNELSKEFSVIDDFSRDSVFSFIRNQLKEIHPRSFLDYGTGDGDFAVMCADLPIDKIVAYDPTPSMVKLALEACRPYSHITVLDSVKELPSESFEVVVLNAVWMCLPTHEICLEVLKDISRLLIPHGRLIVSVTHPCFRMSTFSTTKTDFDNRNYLNDGTEFKVFLSDGINEIMITDTHWSISAMGKQLTQAKFIIEEIIEFPDKTGRDQPTNGSPWMVIEVTKT